MEGIIFYDSNCFDIIDKLSLKCDNSNFKFKSFQNLFNRNLINKCDESLISDSVLDWLKSFDSIYIFSLVELSFISNEALKFLNILKDKSKFTIKIVLFNQEKSSNEIIYKWIEKINLKGNFNLKVIYETSFYDYLKNIDELIFILNNLDVNLKTNNSNQINMFENINAVNEPIKNQVEIYTDGACSGNPGAGGWGAVLLHGNNKKEISGFDPLTTNNKMEMTAVIKALEMLKQRCKVTLYSDSAYVVNAITLGWLNNWKKNGWKGSDKKPVKNIELWLELDKLLSYHQVEFVKVKGHADNELNNRCDELATGEIANHIN